jgi:hypothetical protein
MHACMHACQRGVKDSLVSASNSIDMPIKPVGVSVVELY